MANKFQINQISTLLREVLAQSTGRKDLAALDVAQLLTIGQTAIAADEGDPILKTISQMVSKTIFSARPYKAKLQALRADPNVWGNMVRKLKIINKTNDEDVKDNTAYNLQDDGTVDMYKIDNTAVVQLNFIGQQTYEVQKTIYKDQFNVCFNSAEEFARFISMILTYVANKMEKIDEETARETLVGLIAGISAGETAGIHTGRVVKLLTEYNAATGLKLTNITVFLPENFPDFALWTAARLEQISRMMTEYSTLYQTNLTKGEIDQHTPKDKQRAFFSAHYFDQVQNRVLSKTFHDNLVSSVGASEMVNFWQAIKTPNKINVKTAGYLGKDGNIVAGTALELDNIFGVIMDEEACGYSPILREQSVTPYNSAGHYWNYFWTVNERHWVDFTEKAVVLLLA